MTLSWMLPSATRPPVGLPWTDRTGRLAPLRAAVFVAILLPGLWLALEARQGWLGSRPNTEAIHQAGLWAIRLLAISLAVSPLRAASRYAKLIGIRRMLGVAVLAYTALHLGLYIYDLHFDMARVVSEIVKRLYLLIGFVAFCGLVALGATSTDGMVRRLGAPLWNRLHQLVYAIALLGTVHFFMQSRLDETQPFILGGLFGLLLAARLLRGWSGDLSIPGLAGIAVGAALLTALAEAGWYMWKTHAPFDLVLMSNFDFSYTVRPAWYALAGGAALLVARLTRPLLAKRPRTAESGIAGRALQVEQ